VDTTDFGEPVRQVRDATRSFVEHHVDSLSTKAGERVSEVAESLRRVAQQLRSDATIPFASGLFDRGASAVEHVGRYLIDADGRRLIADAERFARNRPLLAAGVGYVAGLSLSRFLKTGSGRA
jgi:hypothetical protein